MQSWFEFTFPSLGWLPNQSKRNSLPYYSCLLPRVLVQSDMQTALPKIWTQVVDFISFDNSHYAKCTSNTNEYVYMYVVIF